MDNNANNFISSHIEQSNSDSYEKFWNDIEITFHTALSIFFQSRSLNKTLTLPEKVQSLNIFEKNHCAQKLSTHSENLTDWEPSLQN